MNRRIKISSASLAFIPLVIVLFQAFGLLRARGFQLATGGFYFPVLSLSSLIRTFHLNPVMFGVFTLILMVLWSSLIAVVFWKIASAVLAEDEPDRKFDWIGFQVRFFCGAVLGALLGWRFWIGLYRGHNAGPKHTWASLLVCAGVGAVITGLIIGLGWREDFWRRPP